MSREGAAHLIGKSHQVNPFDALKKGGQRPIFETKIGRCPPFLSPFFPQFYRLRSADPLLEPLQVEDEDVAPLGADEVVLAQSP